MTYLTQADMITEYGEEELIKATTQQHPDATPDQINETVLDYAMKNACAMVNSWVGACYALPLPDPLPASLCHLKHIAADLARFYVNEDRPNDETVERKKEAMRLLKKICPDGPILVDDDGAPLPIPESSKKYQVGNTEDGLRCRVFSEKLNKRYPDKFQDPLEGYPDAD